MDHSLLLSSSIIFEGSNLIDDIHQSIIDLENNPPANEVQEIITQSLKYLDNELDDQTMNEIIFLIESCFSHYPNQPAEIFQEIMDNSRKNSNRIIITASILSLLDIKNLNLNATIIESFKTFISESYIQIKSHFQSNDQNSITIYEKQINSKLFKTNFIVNILSIIKMTKNCLDFLSPFIFSDEFTSHRKFPRIIKHILKNGLMNYIPEFIFVDENYFAIFSMMHLSDAFVNISEKTAQKLIPLIESRFSEEKKFIAKFAIRILSICVKYKITFKLMDTLLNSISLSSFKPSYWKYFEEQGIVFPLNFAEKIKTFSNPAAALKTMPDISIIPPDVVGQALLEIMDVDLYQKVFSSYSNLYEINIFSGSSFWLHILNAFSKSEKIATTQMLNILYEIFVNYNEKDKFYEIFYQLLFNEYSNNKGNKFIFDLYYKFNYDYKKEFIENTINFPSIIEKKNALPLPSFWKMFNLSGMIKDNESAIENPIILYAYEFTYLKSSLQITKLSIKPILDNELNSNMVLEFIKHKDIDYLMNVNIESLSFIIVALIFTSSSKKPEILGLTKETIFPFFAIAFIYAEKNNNNLLFNSSDISSLLIDACILLSKNESQLIITSIDTILSSKLFLDKNTFPHENSIEILDNLIGLLINNLYIGDKEILMSSFFCSNDQVLFDKYRIDIFNYIIDNIGNIKDLGVKLSIFQSDMISEVIIDILENSTSFEKVGNIIIFLEKYGKLFPNLVITKTENIIQSFYKNMENKRWKDATAIFQFIQKNNFDNKAIYDNIPNFRTIFSSFISYLNIENQPETLVSQFELIAKLLMKDSSVLSDYFIILFEKISKSYSVDPSLILNNYMNEYIFSGDIFISAIERVFVYNPLKNSFIRKPFFESTLKHTNLCNSLILTLLKKAQNKEGNFQSFVFLTKIASFSTFVFSHIPIKIFESVLPSFSHFSLLVTIQDNCEDQNIIRNVKQVISAMYFLFLSLHCVKVLDAFIKWIYERITTFNESQIFAFTTILSSLFESKKVKSIILGLSIKYKFLEIADDLLEKEVQKEISNQYKMNIFNLIKSHYKNLNKLDHNKKMVFIDVIQEMENPFSHAFNDFSTIFPYELSKLILPKCNHNIILEFIKNMDIIKKFPTKKPENHPTKLQIDEFISHFNKAENVSDFEEASKFSKIITCTSKVKMMSIVSTYPYWIYRWVVKGKFFDPLPEHILILDEVKMVLNQESNQPSDDQQLNKYCTDIKINEYFMQEFCQNKLFNIIINNTISCDDEHLNKLLISLVDTISNDDLSLLCFLDILNLFFINLKEKLIISNDAKKILNLLLSSKISSNQFFNNNFVEICGNNLIELANSPYYRSDTSFLFSVSKLIVHFTKKIPVRIVHLFSFILYKDHPDFNANIADLLRKIGDNNLLYLNKLIEKSFEVKFNNENPSYIVINGYIENFPSLIESKMQQIPVLLERTISDYQKTKDKSNGSLDLICNLFNILAPKKMQPEEEDDDEGVDFSASYSPSSINCLNQLKSSAEMKQLLVTQIPQNIKEKNPIFWNLLEKHRDLINDILLNDKKLLNKMKFLLNYPELLNFKLRLDYFKEKMKGRINNSSTLNIEVTRTNILTESFNQLRKLEPDKWLRKLRVHFINERGVDLGGLTNEWFTLVIKELFNENNALFKLSPKNTYQPNPFSYINEGHIEYFRFAGQLIARALIEDKCVNCHLMRSFFRQILQCKVKLIDLEEYDELLFNQLNDIYTNDTDIPELYFEINADEYGDKTIDLKENGANIQVTKENKKEYVSLYANYRLRKSIINQVDAFCEGFNSLIPHDEICFFSPSELDLLICGIPIIDVDDFIQNIYIQSPYNKDHPVIKLFFSVIAKWDNDKLAKFLLFLTGSSQVPINGFKDFRDKGKKITIAPGGDRSRFCVAHTCNNTLDLPEYESEEEMNEKLIISIQHSEFGII